MNLQMQVRTLILIEKSINPYLGKSCTNFNFYLCKILGLMIKGKQHGNYATFKLVAKLCKWPIGPKCFLVISLELFYMIYKLQQWLITTVKLKSPEEDGEGRFLHFQLLNYCQVRLVGNLHMQSTSLANNQKNKADNLLAGRNLPVPCQSAGLVTATVARAGLSGRSTLYPIILLVQKCWAIGEWGIGRVAAGRGWRTVSWAELSEDSGHKGTVRLSGHGGERVSRVM